MAAQAAMAAQATGTGTSNNASGKRKMSERFAELEECHQKGYISVEEYQAKKSALITLL